MIEVKERPKDGQWVELWEYDGVAWANTYKIEDGVMYRESDNGNYWTAEETFAPDNLKVRFFVAETNDS